MKPVRSMLLSLALLSTSGLALADQVVQYRLDPTHTFITVTWNHFGFSKPSATFTEVTGTLVGNHDAPEKSSVTVSAPVKSLKSGVPLLDQHLVESGEWFDTARHPQLTFTSTRITDVNRQAGTFRLHGKVSLNGHERDLVLDAVVNGVGEHPMHDKALAAGFNATTTVKRSDFGVGAYAPAVSDELDVSITVEALEAEAFKRLFETASQ